MASKQEDRRTRLTKKILHEALIENMTKKPLWEISVKKICEDADVNRSTFYRYYESVNGLYDEVLTEIINTLYEKTDGPAPQPGNNIKRLTNVFYFLQENRSMMLVILKNGENTNLNQKFSELISSLTEYPANTELSRYCADFLYAGIMKVVLNWLSKEDRIDARSLAVVINAILQQGISRAMEISSVGEAL